MKLVAYSKHYAANSPITYPNNTNADIAKAIEAFSNGSLNTKYINDRGIKETVTSPTELVRLIRSGFVLATNDGKNYYITRGGLLGGSPLQELEKKLNNKAPGQKSVFISYNWSQQDIAREMHKEFENRGFLVIRDESNLIHGVYLPEFMKLINHPNLDYVIVVLGDSYLKSKNCMYEVNQIMKRYKYTESLLPFVMTEDPIAKADIYNGIQKYLEYWEGKLANAQAVGNLVDSEVIVNIQKNLQDFINTVRTRINVKETDLRNNRYEAFFQMIAAKEKDNDLSKEINPLLNKSKIFEKLKNISAAENCFKTAIDKFMEIAHLDGIDELGARIYGQYSEFLTRQNRTSEAKDNLDIAINFGYQTASSSSSMIVTPTSQKNVDSNHLKNVDFSALGKTAQETTLKQMADFVWEDLTIKNAHILKDESLRDFNFAKLTAINLSGCKQLTQQVVKQIILTAPMLQKLNLSDTTIEQVQAEDKSALELNKITDLVLNRCQQLHTVKVKGAHLAKVECEDTNLSTLEISSSALDALNLKGNKQLSDQSLDAITDQCRKIKALNIEGCDRITEKQFKTKYPQSYKTMEGIIAYHKSYQEAKTYVEEQIRQANTQLTEANQARLLDLYLILAGIQKLLGDFKAAYESYNTSTNICYKLQEKPLNVVAAFYHMIEFTDENVRYSSSRSVSNLELFNRMLAIIADHFSTKKTKAQQNIPSALHSVSFLGKFWQELFPEAQELSTEVLILKAQTYKCLGIIHKDPTPGSYNSVLSDASAPEALSSYENAIKIYTKIYGNENHVEIAKLYVSMAKIQNNKMENLNRNIECHKKALEIYIRCYGTQDHVDIAQIYFSLGQLHQSSAPDKAILYFENALKIYSNLTGIDRIKQEQSMSLCNYLGYLHESPQKSTEYYDQYLAIALSVSTNSLECARAYDSVATSISRKNHHTKVSAQIFREMTWKCREYYNRAIQIYESEESNGGWGLAATYERMGDLWSIYSAGTGHSAWDRYASLDSPVHWWNKACKSAEKTRNWDLVRSIESKINDNSLRPK